MTRAMWVWVPEAAPPDPVALARFASAQRVTDAFVSVPWGGPSADTVASADALRAHGVRVAALGGVEDWTGVEAVAWMERAVAGWPFDGVHLDIEPWGRADWAGRERELLDALERTVHDVAARSSLPVEVDLAPWVADEHPAAFTRIARRANAVALMAYRDRAPDILRVSDAARRILSSSRIAYRVGVDTAPAADPRATFADDGSAVLERELARVAARLAADARFAGVAVHDAQHWMALPR
ncbi:hypothetical protein [Agrococcus citreus]